MGFFYDINLYSQCNVANSFDHVISTGVRTCAMVTIHSEMDI